MPRYLAWDTDCTGNIEVRVYDASDAADASTSYVVEVWQERGRPASIRVSVARSDGDCPTEDEIRGASKFDVYAEEAIAFTSYADDT